MEPVVISSGKKQIKIYFQTPFLRNLLNHTEGLRALCKSASSKNAAMNQFIVLVTNSKTSTHPIDQELAIRERIAPNYLLAGLDAMRFEAMHADCSHCVNGRCRARLLPFEGECDANGRPIRVTCRLRSLAIENLTSDSELTLLTGHIFPDD